MIKLVRSTHPLPYTSSSSTSLKPLYTDFPWPFPLATVDDDASTWLGTSYPLYRGSAVTERPVPFVLVVVVVVVPVLLPAYTAYVGLAAGTASDEAYASLTVQLAYCSFELAAPAA